MSVGLLFAMRQDAAGRCLSSKSCNILIKINVFSSAFLKLLSMMEEMSLNGESGAFLHTLCSLLEIILVCPFSKLQFLQEFLTAPSGLDFLG